MSDDLTEHFAMVGDTRDGGYICACGGSWATGEGCSFVRGWRGGATRMREAVEVACAESTDVDEIDERWVRVAAIQAALAAAHA